MALLQSEFSVRLVGSPAEVTAFRASLRGPSAHRGAWSRNRTRFYDTGNGALQRAGLEVAVAEAENAQIEKISLVSDHAFPLIRQTLSRQLEEAAMVGGTTGAPVIDTQLSSRLSDLVEIALLDAESWKAVVSRANFTVEIEILQGALKTHGARRPVSEIRFELLKGSREAFFDLVEEAVRDAHGKLRLDAPGAFLADAFSPKARKVRLLAEDSAADVFAAGLGASAARLTELAPYLAAERSGDAGRQMRVALRRFRTLERVFRAEIKRKAFQSAVDRARMVGRAIGSARDWEIFIEDTMSTDEVRGYDPRGAAVLNDLAKDQRGAGWDRAIGVVESEDFSFLLLDLLRGAYCQSWRANAPHLEAPISDFADEALDRRLAKADAVADAINPDFPETQHELRLALKKLRYTAQMFRDLYDKTARKPYFASMSRLQDHFGVLNDAVVAQERCAELSSIMREQTLDSNGAAARTLGFILGWRSAAANDASRDLAETWRQFRQETPFWRLPDPPSPDYIERSDQSAADNEPLAEDESENNPDAEDTDHSLP